MANDADLPPPILERLEQASQRLETPCGDKTMIWHAWGDGPALVLFHGGAGSWRHWVRNIDYFAPRYRVLAADLPGLGESARPPAPTAEAITDILCRGLDDILGPQASYDIAGFSFGGVMAGCTALRHGPRVRSLTIVGSNGLGLRRHPLELAKVRHLSGAERVAANATNLGRLMLADPAAIDPLALEIQDWNSRHTRLKTPDISRTNVLVEALEQAPAKLNGIYGERDAVAWPHLADRQELFHRLRPDSAFRIIPGAGHWVAYEAADAFNTTFQGLLSR